MQHAERQRDVRMRFGEVAAKVSQDIRGGVTALQTSFALRQRLDRIVRAWEVIEHIACRRDENPAHVFGRGRAARVVALSSIHMVKRSFAPMSRNLRRRLARNRLVQELWRGDRLQF